MNFWCLRSHVATSCVQSIVTNAIDLFVSSRARILKDFEQLISRLRPHRIFDFSFYRIVVRLIVAWAWIAAIMGLIVAFLWTNDFVIGYAA